MVKLNQCACTLLEQNKKGQHSAESRPSSYILHSFVFEICHPQGHRIYSGTGPNDETIEEPCLSRQIEHLSSKLKSSIGNVLSQIIFKTKSIDEMVSAGSLSIALRKDIQEGWTSDCLEIISELGNESSGITGEYNIVEGNLVCNLSLCLTKSAEAKEGTEQISDGEDSEEEEEEEEGDDADIEVKPSKMVTYMDRSSKLKKKCSKKSKPPWSVLRQLLMMTIPRKMTLTVHERLVLAIYFFLIHEFQGILYFQPSSNQWVKRFFILNKRELFVHKAASSATVNLYAY